MPGVQCNKISLAFADRELLKEISVFLSAGSRAALTGENGSGKTTFLKILAGLAGADSGDIAAEKGCRISYLPQAGAYSASGTADGKTLWDEAESAFDRIAALIVEKERAGTELEWIKNDGDAARLLEKYHSLEETIEASGYYRRDAVLSLTLKGLGFSSGDFGRKTGEFSGGWQMRVLLAKTLLENPDIMLLDEPTNYLDIEARVWLEEWLNTFKGGYVLVSHDRYFLDVTVNEVYELFQGRVKRYAGNYSAYEQARKQELESLLKRHAAQQEEIAKSKDLIRRFRYKASKAAMVQERIKRLEKMERIEIPDSLKKISVSFPPAPRSGRIAFTLSKIGKSYGERRILDGFDLSLDSGEKLVVAGRNGAGKSTLLRVIAGADLSYSGTVRYGSGIIPAYFGQDSAETLGPESGKTDEHPETVLSFMEAASPAEFAPKLRDMLGAFLFRGDDVYKPLPVLSGGERSRLALLSLLLVPANLLVLDEPTNHLDLASKDILLDALLQFTGTVIFVSHDRAFMEALSTKTLELSASETSPAGGQASAARLFYGNYAYYLGRLEEEKGAETVPVPVITERAGGGEARRNSKQKQAMIRRLEKQEAGILAALEKLEAEKAKLEKELAAPEVYSSGERAKAVQAALSEAEKTLEEKSAEWEARASELAAAKA